jgi:hypothetical protein
VTEAIARILSTLSVRARVVEFWKLFPVAGVNVQGSFAQYVVAGRHQGQQRRAHQFVFLDLPEWRTGQGFKRFNQCQKSFHILKYM